MVYFNDLNDIKKLEKILQNNKRAILSTNTEESNKKSSEDMQIDDSTVNLDETLKKKIKN